MYYFADAQCINLRDLFRLVGTDHLIYYYFESGTIRKCVADLQKKIVLAEDSTRAVVKPLNFYSLQIA
jgi:hypothetical protein